MLADQSLSRRRFLAAPLAAATISALSKTHSPFAFDEPAPKAFPSVDTVLKHLTADDLSGINWIPFIDDPQHLTRKALWRVIVLPKAGVELTAEQTTRITWATELSSWNIVAALASGGPEFALFMLDEAATQPELIAVPHNLGVPFDHAWRRSAYFLAGVGRAGKGNPDVLKRFENIAAGIQRPPVYEHQLNQQDSFTSLKFLELVKCHLGQRACPDLAQLLSLPEPTSREYAHRDRNWNRALMVLYCMGPCDWLGDAALDQIVTVAADNRRNPYCGNLGLGVLGQLGPRANTFLRKLDKLASDIENDQVINPLEHKFTLMHAMASTAAGREDGPELLRRACLMFPKVERGDLFPSPLQCGFDAIGLMNDRPSVQLAKLVLEAPLLEPAVAACLLIFPSQKYHRAAYDPLLTYLSKQQGNESRRRMAAVIIFDASDPSRIPQVQAQIAIEQDDSIRVALQHAIEYLSTIDENLRSVIDVDPENETVRLIPAAVSPN